MVSTLYEQVDCNSVSFLVCPAVTHLLCVLVRLLLSK